MNEMRKNRNRDLFIETACEIIETEGIEAATIRNIAAKAGYNSATIYSYFKNLSHLILCAHMKFEEEIMHRMMETAEKNRDKPYLELWPEMYLIMARFYLKHPNAFECSYIYKNETGMETEIRELRAENSLFQKYVLESMEKIAKESNVTMDAVMRVNHACLALMAGTLLLVIRKRRENDEDMILNQLRDSIEIIIASIEKPYRIE